MTSTSASDSYLSGTAGTYLEEMYESWVKDPKSVHASWDAYFRGASYAPPPSLGITKANEGEEASFTLVGSPVDTIRDLGKYVRGYDLASMLDHSTRGPIPKAYGSYVIGLGN